MNGAAGAAQKVLSTIRRVPPIDSSSDAGSRPSLAGDVVLRDVEFYYPVRPSVHVLQKFNATFAQGKTTAMVGASGSGKSSVIALVMRFYSKQSNPVYMRALLKVSEQIFLVAILRLPVQTSIR